MRLRYAAAAALICVSFPTLLGADDQAKDIEAVKQVITSAYVEGVHINIDADAMRRGFHPDFRMFLLEDDGQVRTISLDDWANGVSRRKAAQPDAPKPNVVAKFVDVSVTGAAAVARVEIRRDSTLIYTDYMSLYRFEDGWKIIGKIFHSHPED